MAICCILVGINFSEYTVSIFRDERTWIELFKILKHCSHLNAFKIGCSKKSYCHVYECDCRRGLDWWLDLLTTYTHDSELQAITTPPLITTAHAKPFPACFIFFGPSLTTASNSGYSSASRAQVLSSQPPMQNSTLNWQLTTNGVAPVVFLITTLHGPSRKHRCQQLLYCYIRIRCNGDVFTDPLPRNDLHNIFCLFAYCIATAVHITVLLQRWTV
jgi:hypothetical protein